MKKIIPFLVVLLFLVFVPEPTARADYWLNFGNWESGSEVSCPLSEICYDPSQPISCQDELPDNCSVYLTEFGIPFLCGTPSLPGEYNFTIDIAEDIYNCSITICPAVPIVSVVSAPSDCLPGGYAELSISATVPNGTLTYQWYEDGHTVPDGNQSTLSVDTSSRGNHSYYCVVTNMSNGVYSSAVSDTFILQISDEQAETAPSLESIDIIAYPAKMAYTVNDDFDPTGLELEAVYTDGSTMTVDSGFTVSSVPFNSSGEKTVAVTYGGQMTTFQVSVEDEICTLSLQNLPYKTNYCVGDPIDANGLQLLYTCSSGTYAVTDGFSLSPAKAEEGISEVTVTFEGISTSYPITVIAKDVERLTVKQLPSKVQYQVGDTLELNGLVLDKISGSGLNAIVTPVAAGYTYEPAVLNIPGSQTVTVYYQGLSTTFIVSVSEAAATAAPLPVLTPGPTAKASLLSQQVSEAVPVSQHTGLVLFIAVIAVLALFILGVYVYIAKTENFYDTAFGQRIQSWFDRFSRR